MTHDPDLDDDYTLDSDPDTENPSQDLGYKDSLLD